MGTGTSINRTAPMIEIDDLRDSLPSFYYHANENQTTQTDQAESGPAAPLTPRRASDRRSNEIIDHRSTLSPTIGEKVFTEKKKKVKTTHTDQAGHGPASKRAFDHISTDTSEHRSILLHPVAKTGSAHDVPAPARSKDGSGQFGKDSAPQDTVTGQSDMARDFSELPIPARAKDLSEQFKNDTALMDAVTGQHDDNRYPTDGRGYLLLINFRHERQGSEKDVNRIKKFFSETLNFEIEHKPDIDEVKKYIEQMNNNTIDNAKAEVRKDDTAQKASDEVYKKSDNDNKYSNKADVQMDKAMQDMDRNTLLEYLRTLKTHIKSTYYCFVCIIMAHGFKDGIYTRNGKNNTELMKEAVLMTEIKDLFDNTSMKQLSGKPKIFIVNSCRGGGEILASAPDTKKKQNLQKDGFQLTPNKPSRALQYSDIAECYATVPDYVSLRCSDCGAVYILTCMHVFENDFEKSDMLEMITSVNKEMQKNENQVAHFVSTLTRKLYLVKFQE